MAKFFQRDHSGRFCFFSGRVAAALVCVIMGGNMMCGGMDTGGRQTVRHLMQMGGEIMRKKSIFFVGGAAAGGVCRQQ
ncbi:MAG: hypothetical protein GXY32_08145 [Ruminococcaceae bacterium]|nr:hypothetical protein [Oscillospiraceae bacterium]